MTMVWPQRFRTIPTPMAGLALGVASVAWCADTVLGAEGWLQATGAAAAAALLLLLAVRSIFHFDTVMADWRHPVAGSIIPTFAMGLMVISKTVGIVSSAAGMGLWLGAVVLHLMVLAGFLVFRLRGAVMREMVPSWFVPPVGIIVADVTFPGAVWLEPVAQGCLWLGLVSYAVMLPLMLYRLFFGTTVAEGARPTLAIMAAPASLSLAGYLTVVPTPDYLLCAVLLGIALLMTFVIYFAFWHLLRLRFTPGYAAFTFPMAIGATALFKAADAVAKLPGTEGYVLTLERLGFVELTVAAVIIGYVFLLYMKHLPEFLADADR